MKKNVLFVMLVLTSLGVSAQTLPTSAPKGNPQNHFSQVKEAKAVNRMALKEQHVKASKLKVNDLKVKAVLSSKKMKDGSLYQIVRLENGMVKKQWLNPAKQLKQSISTNNPQSNRQSNLRAGTESLFEGFEGWDGETSDWIPAGWVDDSHAGSPSDVIDIWEDPINFTWTTSDGGYYVPALTGKYCVGVQFAYTYSVEEGVDITPPSPQDEWLISPSVTVKKDDYVFAFDVNIEAFWARFSGMEGDNIFYDALHTTVEAYISVNGGEWVKKWNSDETILDYTAEELEEIEFTTGAFPWINVVIDLQEYVNQDIKVAVRYWDDGGESVYVDNVTVGYQAPEASYRRPEGYLISGYSTDYYSLTEGMSLIRGNAYTPAQWYSRTKHADDISWNFKSADISTDTPTYTPYLTTNEANPTVSLPYGLYEDPTLSATGKGGTTAFHLGVEGDNNWMAIGGDNLWNAGFSSLTSFNEGNYDLRYRFTAYGDINADDLSPVGVFTGVANYFEKPAGKLLFEHFYVHAGNVVAKSDEPVLLKIYKVEENGHIGDLIASSEAEAEDFILGVTDDETGYEYYTIPFSFKAIDPETNREADAPVEIETDFLVEFTNYESADIFFQYDNHPTGENYAYITFEDGLLSLADLSQGTVNTSLLFDMDAVYPFLYTEDNKYSAPNNGGSKSFNIKTYWHPSQWWLEEELPDWISFGESTLDPETGIVTQAFNVAALPAGVTGRNANVKILAPAAELTLQFKQGDALYDIPSSVTIASAKVARQGDNFVLSYPTGTTAVTAYTIIGQKVATYNLPTSGTFNIPVANWANGVYVLKFSGKTTETLKVIR